MRIYAIGDLHLPGGQEKPMDIFGDHWQDHFAHISRDWQARVKPQDVVLLPGDISWAMSLEQACADLQAIGALPGRKIMIRGNHDYWWSSLTRVRTALPPGFFALQNDALFLDGILFAGTRGWQCPGSRDFSPADDKIYRREVQRLEMSLCAARKLDADAPIIAMIHYPPFNERQEDSGFTELFDKYAVHRVLYGHLHGKSIHSAFNDTRNGIPYRLTSCDALGFLLMEVPVDK